jgi:hypothetical protein
VFQSCPGHTQILWDNTPSFPVELIYGVFAAGIITTIKNGDKPQLTKQLFILSDIETYHRSNEFLLETKGSCWLRTRVLILRHFAQDFVDANNQNVCIGEEELIEERLESTGN